MGGIPHSGRTRGERRRSGRSAVFGAVGWRTPDDHSPKRAWIVEVSPQGVGILTERAETPQPGAVLTPERGSARRLWDRPASVTRVERLSELLDLVAL